MTTPQTCELCGGKTPAAEDIWTPYAQKVTAAKRCFRCYQLEDMIRANPEIAYNILGAMKYEIQDRAPTRMLVWRGKYGPQTFMARTDIELKQAYMRLFQIFNEHECFYDYDSMDENEANYYELATEGDAAAAQWLIELHSALGYEYEDVRIEIAEVPR